MARCAVLVGYGLLAGCSGNDAPLVTGAAGAVATGGAVGSSGRPGQGGGAQGGDADDGGSAGSTAGSLPLAGALNAGEAGSPAASSAGTSSTDGGSAGTSSTDGGSAGTSSTDGGNAGTSGSGHAGSPGAGGALGNDGYNPCPAKGTPCTIMPLGDSITYGYGSSNDDGTKNGGGYRVQIFTKAAAAGVSINFVGRNASGPQSVLARPFPRANEGYSGYTIDQVSGKVPGALAAIKPNIVLLMVGTNDMNKILDVANAPTRLGKIIDQIVAAAPSALLVVGAPIPANGTQDALTKTFDAKVSGVVQQRAAAGKHVIFVDLYAPMAPWSKARFTDSEHPNDAGYQIMGDTWWGKIGALLR